MSDGLNTGGEIDARGTGLRSRGNAIAHGIRSGRLPVVTAIAPVTPRSGSGAAPVTVTVIRRTWPTFSRNGFDGLTLTTSGSNSPGAVTRTGTRRLETLR